MIRDSINNLSRYSFIHRDMDKVIEFFKKQDYECGKYDISPDIFINVMEYDTRAQSDIIYEIHKHYADIQLILNGNESQFYAGLNLLNTIEEYSETKDIAFLKPISEVWQEKSLLKAGDFVVYLPEEAHAPSYSYDDTISGVKKAVVKIKLN